MLATAARVVGAMSPAASYSSFSELEDEAAHKIRAKPSSNTTPPQSPKEQQHHHNNMTTMMTRTNPNRSPVMQSMTMAPLSMDDLLHPERRVEGICVNKKLQNKHDNKAAANSNKVELFLMELEQGNWYPLRNQLLSLRDGDPKERAAFLDRIAAHYRTNENHNNAMFMDAPLWLKGMDEWVYIEPKNPDAFLLYGQLLITVAWSALRSAEQNDKDADTNSGRTSVTMTIFQQRQAQAERKLQVALDLDPTDSLVYVNLLTATRELTQLHATFEQFRAHAKDPFDVTVHETMLTRLSPHWGGSVEEMMAFARASTLRPVGKTQSPPLGHELWTLLPLAHFKTWEVLDTNNQAMLDASAKSQEDYWKGMRVEQRKEIVKAYRKFRSSLSGKNTNKRSLSPERKNKDGNDLFAFCLFGVRAYREAHAEFERIGDTPRNKTPWKRESAISTGSSANYQAVYDKARAKVAAHVAKKNSCGHDSMTSNATQKALNRMASVEAARKANTKALGRQISKEAATAAAQANNQRTLRRRVSTLAAQAAQNAMTHSERGRAVQRRVSQAAANAAQLKAIRRTTSSIRDTPELQAPTHVLRRQISQEAATAANRSRNRRVSSLIAKATPGGVQRKDSHTEVYRRTVSKEAAAKGRKKAMLFQCKRK